MLDRSVLSQLYIELSASRPWKVLGIKAACDALDELLYEPEGTSALQPVLAQCTWLRDKIQPVHYRETVRLSPEQRLSIEHAFGRLQELTAIIEAVRVFNVRTGMPYRTTAEALGYVFRLLLLGRVLSADLVCWSPRADLVRTVLATDGVGVVQDSNAPDGTTRTISSPTPLPFDSGTDSIPYTVLSYRDPTAYRCSVFLSHSTHDKPFARRLAADLSRLEGRVWVDEAEIRPGDSFVGGIEGGLAQADFVLIVLSPDAVASKWVATELRVAISREASEGRPTVIPLLWRTCAIPTILADRAYVDFRDEGMYDNALQQVVRRLGLDV
ncbi:MAG: toll/interleukin-1 receptor domain-containing protein [Acidobacteriota bacterium]|nr:toll/interleukin-1 receptor domain-containing protein [Acidobacteriota bacterium]